MNILCIYATCDVQISNPLSYAVEKFKLINCVSLSTVTSSLPSLLVSDDSLLSTKYPCPLNNGGPVGSSIAKCSNYIIIHLF